MLTNDNVVDMFRTCSELGKSKIVFFVVYNINWDRAFEFKQIAVAEWHRGWWAVPSSRQEMHIINGSPGPCISHGAIQLLQFEREK